MNQWNEWLTKSATERAQLGLTRTLLPRQANSDVIDLASNDYLGLAMHPEVIQASKIAAQTWGTGAKASRLVTGTTSLHTELETELCQTLNFPAALAFSTGYHANLSVLSGLADKKTVVISDAHVHASLIDGVRLARTKPIVTPHNEIAAIAAALQENRHHRCLVLVESIYSVLGDAAPLAELADLAQKYQALLVVDEAHGLGVYGQAGLGMIAELGLADDTIVMTTTFSKSLGAQGGAVLSSELIREQLVNRARPFIFDTGLSPANTAASLAALKIVRNQPELAALVRHRVTELTDLLQISAGAGALVSVPMPSPTIALTAQAECLKAGVRVGCFRPPSVPDGISRLRITVSAGPEEAAWQTAIAVIAETVRKYK